MFLLSRRYWSFFFQAEDGIRDIGVTGVQTCALPIWGVNLDNNSEYLTRSIYVDHLLRWSKFFGEEQMLVLKSENLFERTADTLKLVLDFLDLPDWEPQTREIIPKKRHKGKYKQQMDPATRQRLEEY